MPKGKPPRFRITAWPGRPVDVPPVVAWNQVDGRGWDKPLHWNGLTRRELPDELIFRQLFDQDLDDPSAVVDFLRSFGAILRPASEILPVEAIAKSPTLLDAALELRTARALARHWIAHTEGTDPAEAWRVEGLEAMVAGAAWTYFADILNKGLRAFHVRVEVEAPGMPAGITVGEPQPDLFSGLCLQLANAIVDDVPIRKCANETCGRYFLRQQGRNHYEQRRRDAIYCTDLCARAQASREWRRRQAKERRRR